MNERDRELLIRALELAERGRPAAHPNPLVGAVVARGGWILGEGWHARYGGPHAEVEALKAAGAAATGADLFVSLEPCCHHGKTPPCTEAVIAAGIRRVVYAMEDPHPLVAGKGAARLRAAGIEVEKAPEEIERAARGLNRAWLHHQATGLPWITWKLGQTLDGRLTLSPGTRTAITGENARNRVDSLRAQVDAVIVGVGTVLIDDPGLRVRHGAGRDPWRVAFDTRLRLPLTSRLVRENEDRKTIVVTAETAADRLRLWQEAGVEMITVERAGERLDLREAVRALAARGLLDLLLESGRTLGEAMLAAGLVRRLHVIQSGLIGETRAEYRRVERLGEDICLTLEVPEINPKSEIRNPKSE